MQINLLESNATFSNKMSLRTPFESTSVYPQPVTVRVSATYFSPGAASNGRQTVLSLPEEPRLRNIKEIVTFCVINSLTITYGQRREHDMIYVLLIFTGLASFNNAISLLYVARSCT